MQDVKAETWEDGRLPDAGARPRRRLRDVPRWLDRLLWLGLGISVAHLCFFQGYHVYGACMEPNLCSGERILGSRLALMQGIRRGDVVVFQVPEGSGAAFVKRVIGLPGDLLEIRGSRVFINRLPLPEPYVHRTWHDDRLPQHVPAGSFFVLGDNRDDSNDSRSWGFLPAENV
ncbi:MAG: signal peptidase I, partial [SAR202 cluster bacterium]|nr:signal peptidase I [SAR202 cluster bacterium]